MLGYSTGGADRDLHPVCAARLARAAEETGPGDAVLFSGWRRGGAVSEAELMARGWTGRAGQVLLDTAARTTYGNVAGSGRGGERGLRSRGGRRDLRLARPTRGDPDAGSVPDIRSSSLQPTNAERLRARLRELACWLLVPFQIALVRRTR